MLASTGRKQNSGCCFVLRTLNFAGCKFSNRNSGFSVAWDFSLYFGPRRYRSKWSKRINLLKLFGWFADTGLRL